MCVPFYLYFVSPMAVAASTVYASASAFPWDDHGGVEPGEAFDCNAAAFAAGSVLREYLVRFTTKSSASSSSSTTTLTSFPFVQQLGTSSRPVTSTPSTPTTQSSRAATLAFLSQSLPPQLVDDLNNRPLFREVGTFADQDRTSYANAGAHQDQDLTSIDDQLA
ncbi:unnamed protein product, partial [Amoebophrya sp. A120]|eukprot:GSA120T00023103001.1